jgi:hypothetical protein
MIEGLRPSKAEVKFLQLAYNRFYDIRDQVESDEFWEKGKYYRLSRMKDAFSIYGELLEYQPIKWVNEQIRENRPPMEAEIVKELVKVIRNIFAHFPFFESWDDVWVEDDVINWAKPGQSVDTFLRKYDNHDPVKYRYWQSQTKKMTYITFSFPNGYANGERVWLKDLISEREGVTFCILYMTMILDTQVVGVKK